MISIVQPFKTQLKYPLLKAYFPFDVLLELIGM